MTRRMSRVMGALACTVLALATVGMACTRESSAQPATSVVAGAPAHVLDDSAALARLLTAVRGVDPLLCELATRSVDMHASWSRWGPFGDNPLEVDSAATILLTWIQNDHKDPAVVPRLRAAMGDPDACVRRVAGSFLGRIEHPSATSALLAGLDDARAETRYVAALGLGLSERKGTIDPLVKRLKDESASVRRAAAWSLGALEANAALLPLVEALQKDPDARVRQAAAWALGQLKE